VPFDAPLVFLDTSVEVAIGLFVFRESRVGGGPLVLLGGLDSNDMITGALTARSCNAWGPGLEGITGTTSAELAAEFEFDFEDRERLDALETEADFG